MKKRAPILTLLIVLLTVSMTLPALAQEDAEKATAREKLDARGLCRYDGAANKYASFEEIPLSLIGKEARPGDRPAEGFAGCEALNRIIADVESGNAPPDIPDGDLGGSPTAAEEVDPDDEGVPDESAPSPGREGSPYPLTKGPETAPPERPSGSSVDQEAEDPLARDARWYAGDQGVSLEEAIRRLKLQEELSLSGLGPALEANEGDAFAGLWIQHEPEYRFVVLFTHDGEETIRPYIEGEPWADVVEVRNGAGATLAELEAAQAEAGRIVRDLGIRADSGINVQENRVELYVTERARLDAALREAGLRLPDHVAVIEVEGLSEPATGAASSGKEPEGETTGGEESFVSPSEGPAGEEGSPAGSGSGAETGGSGGSPSGGGGSGNGSGGGSDRGGTDNEGGSNIANVGDISGLLPGTGGLPLAVFGAGVLLVGGGFLVRRIAR